MDENQAKKLASKKDKPVSALDRLIMQTIGDNMLLGDDADPASEQFPLLWDWLTRTSAGKGHVMQPARLTLSCIPGGVNANLSHRGLNLAVECVSDTLQGTFAALEALLASANPGIKTFSRGAPKIKKRNGQG